MSHQAVIPTTPRNFRKASLRLVNSRDPGDALAKFKIINNFIIFSFVGVYKLDKRSFLTNILLESSNSSRRIRPELQDASRRFRSIATTTMCSKLWPRKAASSGGYDVFFYNLRGFDSTGFCRGIITPAKIHV